MKQNSPLKTFCNAKKPEKKREQQRKKVIRTATNVTTRIIQSHLTSSTNRALAKIQRPEQMVHLNIKRKTKKNQDTCISLMHELNPTPQTHLHSHPIRWCVLAVYRSLRCCHK